jgi:hypothetical protein
MMPIYKPMVQPASLLSINFVFVQSLYIYQATLIQHSKDKHNVFELLDVAFTESMFSESPSTSAESTQHALKRPRLDMKDTQTFSFEKILII